MGRISSLQDIGIQSVVMGFRQEQRWRDSEEAETLFKERREVSP